MQQQSPCGRLVGWQARFMARRLVGQSDPKRLAAYLPCWLADLPCLPTSLGSGAALLVCPFTCLSLLDKQERLGKVEESR